MTAALLLAEPEPATRGYLERQLANDGFHVLQAAFGGEALALAERTRPDLVLCSELDLCARLREGEPGRTWNRDVPVIVLGPEEADAVDRVRAFQRGADDYLHGRSSTTSCSPGSAPCCAARRRPRRDHRGRRPDDRPARPGRRRPRRDRSPGGQGVRASLRARGRAAPRLHEGRAAPRRLGLPLVHANANTRFARLAAAPEARAGAGRPLRRQRVGGGLQAGGLTIDPLQSAVNVMPT